MYEAFYGLTACPFTKTPDPKFLFLSRSHEEALARLQYAVEEKELILLTGDVGCGKTTLTRALMDILGESYKIVTIINPVLTSAQFLPALAKRLDIDIPSLYKSDCLMRFMKRFTSARSVYTDSLSYPHTLYGGSG